MEETTKKILQTALPGWAIKDHPTRKGMSVIHPMAVIDVLNEAFGVGAWKFHTEHISCEKEVQKVAVWENGKKSDKTKDREIYISAVKGTLIVPKLDIHIEQFGGSTNDDKGDALKGGATDALTKCASYLGVGATIYKGQGNIDGYEMSTEEAWAKLSEAGTLDELTKTFKSLPAVLQKDAEVIAKATELKNKLA